MVGLAVIHFRDEAQVIFLYRGFILLLRRVQLRLCAKRWAKPESNRLDPRIAGAELLPSPVERRQSRGDSIKKQGSGMLGPLRVERRSSGLIGP